MAKTARDRWSALVEEWRRSGLPARDFAAKKRVKAQTLGWWAWRLGARKRAVERVEPKVGPLSFIEVTAAADAEVVEPRLEIVLARGRRILARDGIELARSTVCGWHMQLVPLVKPVVDAMRADAFRATNPAHRRGCGSGYATRGRFT